MDGITMRSYGPRPTSRAAPSNYDPTLDNEPPPAHDQDTLCRANQRRVRRGRGVAHRHPRSPAPARQMTSSAGRGPTESSISRNVSAHCAGGAGSPRTRRPQSPLGIASAAPLGWSPSYRVKALGHWGAVVTPECPNALTPECPTPAVPYLGTGHGLLMKSGAQTGTPYGTVIGPLHGGLGGSKP